ncbi:MAG: 1-acyl-sn-glycerol-3-phosphate acyltransferase [Flavobacteriales bacterium]|nr:1-acyl-sn-glycerol-3-phosphate acyltransferase [Flavobacteriales bacterium]|tara:strand:+ start:288 stop:1004 length:717 start_codon:yes stop_codon:yes gene_type:complete
MINRDVFGNILFIKRFLIWIIGNISYKRFRGINHLIIQGSEIISSLPDTNVLFISNHQTYFADATAMLHVFNASLNGRYNSLKNSSYLNKPKLNIYYVAAKETMNSGIIPKILSYTGAISISRTWRNKNENIDRPVNLDDVGNISKALKNGWLITFPQGTTKPFSPIRKGTAHIIMNNKPIVVPIIIDGFRRSFDKTGLRIKKKGIQQSMRIMDPVKFDYKKDSIETITEKIAASIGQ